MSPNTSQLGHPSPGITVVLTLVTLLVTIGSVEHSSSDLQCLLNEEITTECMNGLDAQYWPNQQPQYTTVICPTLVSLMEKHSIKQGDELFSQLTSKATRICQAATSVDPDNGYLLFVLYIAQGSYTSALKLEYQLFFNDPFQHEKKITSALQKLTQYLQQRSPPTSNQSEQAAKMFYLSKFEESLKHIQAAISNQSSQLSQIRDYLIFLKFRILEKNGQFPDALTLVNQLLEKTGQKSHWYLHHIKGNLLMHHLKFKQAIYQFELAIKTKRDINFVFSLYNIGLCYQKMGKYRESIEYLKKIHTPQPDVLNSIGFGYYSLIENGNSDKQNKKNAQQAQNYFTKAINADSTYYLAYYNFGVLKYDLGEYPQAAQNFEKSIKFNPNGSNISSKYGLFKALYKINKENAMQFFQGTVTTAEGFTPSDAGAILHELGEDQEALRYLQKAVELKSNLGEVYERKGMVQFGIGLFAEAMESFKKALQSGNTRSSVWFNLAYLEEQGGSYQRALYLYQKALEADPKGPAKDMISQLKQKIQQEKAKSKQNNAESQL